MLLPNVLKKHLATRLATADPSVGEEQGRGAAERVEASLRYEKNGLASVVVRTTHLQGFVYWRRVNAVADELAAAGDDRPVAQRRVSAILRLAGVVMPGCSADGPDADAAGPTRGAAGADSRPGGGPSSGGATCGSSDCTDVPVLDVDLLVPLGLASGPVTLDGLSMTAEQAQDALRHSRHVRVSTVDPETGGVLTVSRPVPEPRRPGPPPPDDSVPPDPPPPDDSGPPDPPPPDDGRPPDPPPPDDSRPPDPAATRPSVDRPDVVEVGPPNRPPLDPEADAVIDRVVALLRAALAQPVRLTTLHTDGYRPTVAGHRYTKSRDVICTQPACDRPATACDTDHQVPWPLGPTCPCNTGSRCRFDHLLKQSGGTVVRLPDGDTVWTTADGLRSYRRPALLDERVTAHRAEVGAAVAWLARRRPLRRPREPGRPVLVRAGRSGPRHRARRPCTSAVAPGRCSSTTSAAARRPPASCSWSRPCRSRSTSTRAPSGTAGCRSPRPSEDRDRGQSGQNVPVDELTVYGADWCPDVRRSRALLDSAAVPYAYVDVEADPQAEATVRRLQDGARRIPTIVLPDGSVLVEPDDSTLTAALAAAGLVSR